MNLGELDPTEVTFALCGQEVTVDAFEADAALARIDTTHKGDDAARWDAVRGYVNSLAGQEVCSVGQAMQFYNGVVAACRHFTEADKKKRGTTADSPTGTASTPGVSAIENGGPGSPTSSAATPNESTASAT